MKRFPHAGRLVTEEELVVEIAVQTQGYGNARRLAREIGISQGGLANILGGDRRIGRQVAAALGYRRVVLFERVE